MACNSKLARPTAKLSEIWDSWILVTKIWGTFDLVGFKVILGSFSALVSEWPVKMAGCRLKQSEIIELRHTSNTYMGQYSLHLCTAFLV